MVGSYCSDLYYHMGIMEVVIQLPSFCIWREEEKLKKISRSWWLRPTSPCSEFMCIPPPPLPPHLFLLPAAATLRRLQVEVCFTFSPPPPPFRCDEVAVGYGSPSTLICTLFSCPSKKEEAPGIEIQSEASFFPSVVAVIEGEDLSVFLFRDVDRSSKSEEGRSSLNYLFHTQK